MNKYYAEMPLRTQRTIQTVIGIVSACSVAGVGIIVLLDSSRPVSQMPWYFWPMIVGMTLVWLFKPSDLLWFHHLDERAVSVALMAIAASVFVITLAIVAIIFLHLSGSEVYLLALGLPHGFNAVRYLLRRRQQGNL